VREEEVAGLAPEIAKAQSRVVYAEAQLARIAYLTRGDNASQQALDQAKNDAAAARADGFPSVRLEGWLSKRCLPG
jgi:multidrug resistance efflux pump